MDRVRLVAASFLLLGGAAIAYDTGAPTVYVEGYLDKAPAGAQAVEEVQITHDGRDRVLIVVTARSGERGSAQLVDHGSELAPQVRGSDEDVALLMNSEEGSRIRATIKYYPGSRSLLLEDVDS
jgi:hypothetical protein